MSGTSVDGVDVALCRFHEDTATPGDIGLEMLNYIEQPFPDALRAQIFAAFAAVLTPADLCELSFALGEVYGAAALRGLDGFNVADVNLIASHGQTLYHQVAAGRRRSTWQAGDAAIIAGRTGVTVAHDFRPADIAAGGQGAPLVPYFDALFLRDPTKNRALVNIGGIGNVTFLPADGIPFAFDTGPGNMIVDYAARAISGGGLTFDRDGVLAGAGRVDAGWLAELMAHPYLAAPPPKSTGREVFGDEYAATLLERARVLGLSDTDIVATLTAFTARSIADALRRFAPAPIDEVILSGGGTYNPVMRDMLAERIGGAALLSHDSFGVRADSKEAVAFALLGYELLRNRPTNIGTGAPRPAVLGKLAPGLNYAPLLRTYAPLMTDFNPEDSRTWPKLPRLHIL